MKIPRYMIDSKTMIFDTIVTRIDRDQRGQYAVCDDTIFHPQGGGQPADRGKFKFEKETVDILHVATTEGEIRHYGNFSNLEPSPVIQSIDTDYREQNAKIHSAGHLISVIVERNQPSLVSTKGYHFPEGPYIEFEMKGTTCIPPSVLEDWNQDIETLVQNRHPVVIKLEEPNQEHQKVLRLVTIESIATTPCGGMHVSNTGELAGLRIAKTSTKQGKFRVSYRINT